MNPYSPPAVAYRAESYRKSVAIRDRLAGEATSAPDSPDIESRLRAAETNVRATLSRMMAMGDPDPAAPMVRATQLPPETPALLPSAHLATAPAAPAAAPRAPTVAQSQLDKLVAEILGSAAIAAGEADPAAPDLVAEMLASAALFEVEDNVGAAGWEAAS